MITIMKITKARLKQIIKEELALLNEGEEDFYRAYRDGHISYEMFQDGVRQLKTDAGFSPDPRAAEREVFRALGGANPRWKNKTGRNYWSKQISKDHPAHKYPDPILNYIYEGYGGEVKNAAALGGIEIVNPADARSPNAQEWMIKLVGPYAKMYKNMDQIPIEGDLSPDSTIDEVFMAIYEFLEKSPEERDRY